MNIIYIAGEINQASADKFILDFNKVPESQQIVIYINIDSGGEVSHSQIMTDIINAHKHRTTLIAGGAIYSAAFNLFFDAQCTRIILEDTTGMAHFSWATFNLSENGKPDAAGDKFLMKLMKTNKHKTIQRFKEIGLNTKEISRIRQGTEVYFTTERLKELLHGQNCQRSK